MNFEDIKELTIIENSVILDGRDIEIDTALEEGIDAVQFHKTWNYCIEEPELKQVPLTKYKSLIDAWETAKDLIDNPILTVESLRTELLNKLINSIDYEEGVTVDEIIYKGGYESAQRLLNKRNLAIQQDKTTLEFLDVNDDIQTLTLEQSLKVYIAIAEDYETKFYKYKKKKKEIESCSTLKQLEEIEI